MAAQSVTSTLNTNFIMAGTDLGNGITYPYTIPSTGIYRISLQTTVTPPSDLVITVNKNGYTVYTTPSFTPTQSVLQFQTDLLCTAADSITVNLTSSTALEQAVQYIQTTCQIVNGI